MFWERPVKGARGMRSAPLSRTKFRLSHHLGMSLNIITYSKSAWTYIRDTQFVRVPET